MQMKRLQPVIWTKGTFLTPQHLQLQDRFLENLLEFNLENLSFRPWGFATLQVSREALAGGVLGITSASGLLPDGLIFDIPASHSAPPPKQLAECFDPDQSTLDIYLAVPQYRERGLNVGSTTRDSGARYRAEIETFRDENTGLSEKPVQVARNNCGSWRKGRIATATRRFAWPVFTVAKLAPSSWTRASCRLSWISRPTIIWFRLRAA